MTSAGIDSGALVAVLGSALLRFSAEGCVVGVAAAAALFLLRGAGPRARYAACAAALVACVLLPAWHVVGALACVDGDAGEAVAEVPSSLAALLPRIVLAWSLGAAAMSLRLGAGLLWVSRLRARSQPVPAWWTARFGTLAQRLRLSGRARLRQADGIDTPLAIGWWRPVVIVPTALLARMPPELVEALLAHELAHVLRRDYLVNLLQSAAEALLFFHPVVWWLSARLRIERELVADEIAAAAIGEGARLASALHELACPSASAPLAMAATGGSLRRRVELLLAPRSQGRCGRAMLAASLLAAAGLAAAWPRPAAHEARSADARPSPASLASAADLRARHALVLDERSGQVLLAKDADAVVPIASLTKLMTAMVVLDAGLRPDEPLRIAATDAAARSSAARLRVGAAMTRGDALRLALLASDNRAAAALARTYPGGSQAFEAALAAKARSLRLAHTTLVEPTGLSADNTSTASEMARIVAASATYREIAAITSAATDTVVIDGRERPLANTNRLVGDAGWDIRLSKTGFTRAAGGCLTMRLRAGGRDLTLVLLDSGDGDDRQRDALALRHALDVAAAAPVPARIRPS